MITRDDSGESIMALNHGTETVQKMVSSAICLRSKNKIKFRDAGVLVLVTLGRKKRLDFNYLIKELFQVSYKSEGKENTDLCYIRTQHFSIF
jgi:hypothetical protein